MPLNNPACLTTTCDNPSQYPILQMTCKTLDDSRSPSIRFYFLLNWDIGLPYLAYISDLRCRRSLALTWYVFHSFAWCMTWFILIWWPFYSTMCIRHWWWCISPEFQTPEPQDWSEQHWAEAKGMFITPAVDLLLIPYSVWSVASRTHITQSSLPSPALIWFYSHAPMSMPPTLTLVFTLLQSLVLQNSPCSSSNPDFAPALVTLLIVSFGIQYIAFFSIILHFLTVIIVWT
jgi:hypothetical protein